MVPVQNIDTVHLQISKNNESSPSAKHSHCTFADIQENCTKY